jgi:hypothetical protein
VSDSCTSASLLGGRIPGSTAGVGDCVRRAAKTARPAFFHRLADTAAGSGCTLRFIVWANMTAAAASEAMTAVRRPRIAMARLPLEFNLFSYGRAGTFSVRTVCLACSLGSVLFRLAP